MDLVKVLVTIFAYWLVYNLFMVAVRAITDKDWWYALGVAGTTLGFAVGLAATFWLMTL